MSNVTLIIGESGSGKSSSIRNLNPEETFVISIIEKPLPFKLFKKNYMRLAPDGLSGNYFVSDDYSKIIKAINVINSKRHEIKYLILDDFQYLMCNEFIRRGTEKGFDKFTEIAQHTQATIQALTSCRDDLYCFVMGHNDIDDSGISRPKTIGKMIDKTLTIEGIFTVVFHTLIVDGQYKFLTKNTGSHIAKSPLGMFDNKLIDNDISHIVETMKNYYGEDICQ